MPLAEIRNYLEQRSPEKFGVLLEQEEKVVREKMQRLREMQRWIGEKKRFLAQASVECREAFEKDPFCPVGIHTLPLQYLVTNHSESADNLAVNQKIGELYAYCGQYGNRSSYNVGFVQKRETLETGNFLDYRDFYLILIVCRRKCDTRFGRRESIFVIIIKDHGRELKRRTGSCSGMPRNRDFCWMTAFMRNIWWTR